MSGYAKLHDYGDGDSFNGIDYEERTIDNVVEIKTVCGCFDPAHLCPIEIHTDDGDTLEFSNARVIESEVEDDV